jgi:hypothetical protein
VINTGFLVRRTLSRTARHVALNSEMAILSMQKPQVEITMVKDHGQL